MNVRRSLCGVMTIVGSMALLAGCFGYHKGKLDTKLHAKAVIAGTGITGEAHTYEEYEGARQDQAETPWHAGKQVEAGDAMRSDPHSRGRQLEPFSAATGHYDGNIDPQVNPEANVSPGLGNLPYHLGDLSALMVDENRKGSIYTITSRVTLSEGFNTLFDTDGSAFIIHEVQDRYLPDPPTKDAPGEPRIACGIIVKE